MAKYSMNIESLVKKGQRNKPNISGKDLGKDFCLKVTMMIKDKQNKTSFSRANSRYPFQRKQIS